MVTHCPMHMQSIEESKTSESTSSETSAPSVFVAAADTQAVVVQPLDSAELQQVKNQ
jgi:hypothetical protein